MKVVVQEALEGDWVNVFIDGNLLYSGHHMPTSGYLFASLLEGLKGYDRVVYETKPGEEIS